jgi:imidazolonepropionase-like amidohydrolase
MTRFIITLAMVAGGIGAAGLAGAGAPGTAGPASLSAIARSATAGAQAEHIYAIQGARIVPVSGPVIENGTIVFRDGVITAVGAKVTVPAGAQLVEGKGLSVYPGLIDMGSTVGLAMPAVPRVENPNTREDVERVKADYLLRAQWRAADHVDPVAPALGSAASAGITSVLATPSGDAIRGQSALITTVLPDDEPQIGAVADERKGVMVLKTPVALHVTFSRQPAGGSAYPNSLMGVIAFVRQAFLDAQHFAAVRTRLEGGATAPPVERGAVRLHYQPAFEAMQPALAGRLPVAFEGETVRDILRGLDMAKSFKLDPIVTNGREAGEVAADLKAVNARVILSLNYPTRPQNLAPDADESLRTLRARADAPKTAAALAKAGVPFAFATSGLKEPRDFIKNAAKAVESGLSREDAVRALTLQAATIAGAAERLGSLEAGKIANVLVTEGDLFDEKMQIKHVFVDGRPVRIEAPAREGNRRGQ